MTRRATVLKLLNRVLWSISSRRFRCPRNEGWGPVKISSRRGEIVAPCRSDDGLQPKSIFIPFCYEEAAANLLTNAAWIQLEK
ncbi:MAG: hypothetical protein CM1200mP18_20000 [Gammaproteobacteria bacterium]|nr:MAG: hypothetical protein CM1200mP18_20000 [Gammaproteobacteria bacterium]